MESRSYQVRRPPGGADWVTPAIRQIFYVITGVFLLQTMLLVLHPPFYQWFLLQFGVVPYDFVFRFKLWQPVTYIFLHGGVFHWFLNLLVLWMFGCDVERMWGRKKFLQYFMVTGVGAGLCVVALKILASMGGMTRSDSITIGSSGAVYGVLMAAAVLFPDRQVWVFPFPVTIPMRPFVFIMGLIAFFGSLGAGNNDGVSDVAHLSGLLIGWAHLRRGTYFFSVKNIFLDWKQRRLRRRFEVYQRRHREPPSQPDNWLN